MVHTLSTNTTSSSNIRASRDGCQRSQTEDLRLPNVNLQPHRSQAAVNTLQGTLCDQQAARLSSKLSCKQSSFGQNTLISMGNGREKKESFFKFDITAERIGLEETLGMFVDALPINSDLSDFFLLNFLGMFVYLTVKKPW